MESTHAKRVFHMGDRGLASFRREGNPHDVETKGRRSGLGSFQVHSSSAHHAGSLVSIHRFKWMSAFFTRA